MDVDLKSPCRSDNYSLDWNKTLYFFTPPFRRESGILQDPIFFLILKPMKII